MAQIRHNQGGAALPQVGAGDALALRPCGRQSGKEVLHTSTAISVVITPFSQSFRQSSSFESALDLHAISRIQQSVAETRVACLWTPKKWFPKLKTFKSEHAQAHKDAARSFQWKKIKAVQANAHCFLAKNLSWR